MSHISSWSDKQLVLTRVNQRCQYFLLFGFSTFFQPFTVARVTLEMIGNLGKPEDGNANVGRQEKYFFVILVFYWAYLYFGSPVSFYLGWNSVDSSVSSWTKRWTLVLEVSATFSRQRGNGAVEVSFESENFFSCSFVLQIGCIPTDVQGVYSQANYSSW